MRLLVILTLLSVVVPVFAQAPPPLADSSVPAPSGSVAPAADPVLDSLIHRPQIVRITKQDGTRFLGRVVGGDHGVYIIQTFHFAGPPRVESTRVVPSGIMPPGAASTGVVPPGALSPRGRSRTPRSLTPRSRPARRIVRTYSETTLSDNKAIPLLLTGVAGSNVHPREIPEKREILTEHDVREIEALSPPSTKPAVASSAPAAQSGSPSAGTQADWTLTTLWPTAAQGTSPVTRKPRHRRGSAPSASPTGAAQ